MYSYRTVTVWSSRFGAWDLTTNTGKSPPIQKGALAVMQRCLITASTSRRTANAVSCALETAAFPSTYFMCTLEYLTGRWRFGYSLNQPRPDMYPDLILTGIWYCPAWSGAAPGESGTRTSNPTSIMGQWSWKCPGSPHLQQVGPGLTAAPAAEGWARDCRREYCGEVVGSAPPPSPGVTVALSIPTPWRGSRGHRQPQPGSWDWEGDGREGGRERERERLGRGSPTPGHAARWSSASWMAWPSDVGRWHRTYSAVRRGSRVTNCSSTTRSITPSTSQGCMMAEYRLPRPGFRHQCSKVRGSGKEGRGSQGWRATKKVFNNTK